MAEKSQGRWSAGQVASLSLEDIRLGGPQRVRDKFLGLNEGQVCIVNAVEYADLDVLVNALAQVEQSDRRLLYRTAASFVRALVGQPEPGLWTIPAWWLPARTYTRAAPS